MLDKIIQTKMKNDQTNILLFLNKYVFMTHHVFMSNITYSFNVYKCLVKKPYILNCLLHNNFKSMLRMNNNINTLLSVFYTKDVTEALKVF